jgi:putative ABC transport system substrate-binding protein
LPLLARQLLDLKPDLIVAQGTPGLAAARDTTRTLPIIFAEVTDPVGQGFVESLSRPGGNLTGFAPAAPYFGIQPSCMEVGDETDVERKLTSLGREPNSGLIVLLDAFTYVHRDFIIGQGARHRIPAIYTVPFFTEAGGLVSYGVDLVDQFRKAAIYADRILKGAKPADLPVQQPTKFKFVINVNTAKTLGLAVPLTLLATADELIEDDRGNGY